MATGEIKTITSLSQYVKYVEDIKHATEGAGNKADLLFRGQPCDQPLIPKLGRLKLKGELVNTERLMMDEFARTSLPFAEFEPKGDWDFIALAQHHGLPTRLLDWTQGAYTALWFAVHLPFKASEKLTTSGHGVVWVFAPDVEDYLLNVKEASPFDNKSITKIFRPRIMSRRISAQAGMFTVHKIIDKKRFIALEKNNKYKHKLTKFIIPPRNFASLRKDLHMFNINYSSQFPDLDGLSHHLEWRHSWFNDEKQSDIK